MKYLPDTKIVWNWIDIDVSWGLVHTHVHDDWRRRQQMIKKNYSNLYCFIVNIKQKNWEKENKNNNKISSKRSNNWTESVIEHMKFSNKNGISADFYGGFFFVLLNAFSTIKTINIFAPYWSIPYHYYFFFAGGFNKIVCPRNKRNKNNKKKMVFCLKIKRRIGCCWTARNCISRCWLMKNKIFVRKEMLSFFFYFILFRLYYNLIAQNGIAVEASKQTNEPEFDSIRIDFLWMVKCRLKFVINIELNKCTYTICNIKFSNDLFVIAYRLTVWHQHPQGRQFTQKIERKI